MNSEQLAAHCLHRIHSQLDDAGFPAEIAESSKDAITRLLTILAERGEYRGVRTLRTIRAVLLLAWAGFVDEQRLGSHHVAAAPTPKLAALIRAIA
jgi:hypothetical protein